MVNYVTDSLAKSDENGDMMVDKDECEKQ